MPSYFFRRILLIVPTLFGILTINFIIIQAAPGGPVERMLAQMRGDASNSTSKFMGSNNDLGLNQAHGSSHSHEGYQGSRGLDPELVEEIKKLYGFDKSALARFWLMLKNYLRFNLGDSYFRDISVVNLLKEKLPVSISLGLWSSLIIYGVSIPLGIRKAVREGSAFDVITSTIIIAGYAIPSFLFAIMLIVLFAGGSFWDIFPLRGLVSEGWNSFPWYQKITDYLWHITLPILAIVISGFASLTLLTKNSFIDEINKNYVLTARAKGLSESRVLYGHIFRNAVLIIVSGLPRVILGIFFAGSLLIEIIFTLDGIGLMSFESAINRDYPVVFGTLYIFTLLGLIIHLLNDLSYALVDPRINFDNRKL